MLECIHLYIKTKTNLKMQKIRQILLCDKMYYLYLIQCNKYVTTFYIGYILDLQLQPYRCIFCGILVLDVKLINYIYLLNRTVIITLQINFRYDIYSKKY